MEHEPAPPSRFSYSDSVNQKASVFSSPLYLLFIEKTANSSLLTVLSTRLNNMLMRIAGRGVMLSIIVAVKAVCWWRHVLSEVICILIKYYNYSTSTKPRAFSNTVRLYLPLIQWDKELTTKYATHIRHNLFSGYGWDYKFSTEYFVCDKILISKWSVHCTRFQSWTLWVRFHVRYTIKFRNSISRLM